MMMVNRLLGFVFIVVISCYAWVPMNDNHDYNHDAHHDNNCHYGILNMMMMVLMVLIFWLSAVAISKLKLDPRHLLAQDNTPGDGESPFVMVKVLSTPKNCILALKCAILVGQV